MYDDNRFFKFFLLLMKLITGFGMLLIAFNLIENAIYNYPMTRSSNPLVSISIYAAILSGLLNIFQVICLFFYLNRIMKICYVITVFISNLLLIFVSIVWLSVYQFMFLGVSLGLLGLILISFQIGKNSRRNDH
ncbi:hypothetical protein DLJ48_06110 [Oenococcus sicerae]|uniref:Uncharacterized protein n=2 Tax=Oenococcus sicerae TaxID=2203724 RepID=A0AAJ1RAV6_9LACO|nr:hypothetical protein [Oenococcus sicerae]MDN6899427.1 hypothetical protein [Oenococcus sicerae]QAS70127.1 hypothetical protein DLJ48_06110 [Oenococcus sicerae]VDK13697.1 hypothetical protein OAL24_00493 [Oenococcus sicerae]